VAGRPEPVRVHDFLDKRLGKAIPYGAYDVLRNRGWVSVGIDHDTARLAVRALRRWWQTSGAGAFPGAGGVLITADGGGSNGCRNRPWKVALQEWADESGWSIAVSQGITVSGAELHAVRLHRQAFHGEWNYTIKPKR
jgi:hypothetical protein